MDKKTLKTDSATIYQTNENCQVFNGPISGCVFAMSGATVNQSPVQRIAANNENEMGTGNLEEPLRNHIFDSRVFDSNDKLTRLRDTIAAAIDMGDATIMYGEPQAIRINPAVQSEWYYIVKSIEEAKVAHGKLSVTGFIEQMMEWYPMLFPDGTKEEWEKFKRKLSNSISGEKNLWRKGKMKEVVPLREMWAKGIANVLGNAKANRVYEMAYKGLYTSLTSLKHELERENNSK